MMDEFDDYEERHPFDIDVHALVLTNLKLALDGIDRLEQEEITSYVRETDNDEATQQSFISWIQGQHENLRTAAIHLALVGLVTRFHHWLVTLANSLRDDTDKTFDKSVQQEMHFLNNNFKSSPHQPRDFAKWIDVRDSVIHADSQAAWQHEGKLRGVESQFTHIGELHFTATDLQDAFQKMLWAIAWYEGKTDDWYEAKHGPTLLIRGQPPNKS